jgi:hypothetical protein
VLCYATISIDATSKTQCLEELVFTPTVKNVLVRYMDGMTLVLSSLLDISENLNTVCSSARTACDNLAMSTRAEVEKAMSAADVSGLRASFGHALSFSIPPLTLYCNYRRDASADLVFGVPLADLSTNQHNIPNVLRECIEEIEKRGLNTHKIYSVSRSRRVFGFIFSVAGGFYIRSRDTAGQWNPSY